MKVLWSSNLLYLLLLLLLVSLSRCEAQNEEVLYEGCDIDDYYGASLLEKDPSEWTRKEVEALLQSTHRDQLPYTSSTQEDVWDALIDLDQGDSENTVRLVYRNVDVPATPYGEPDTWNREHLWPKSRGVETAGKDFTDVHHLRPADWNVNSARSNLFFGECWAESTCKRPATTEAAADTASDGNVFTPPAVYRGDIARAIFYMALRYSGTDGGDNLVVTDCPTDEQIMAYLSPLLEWHASDLPTDRERLRNDRACKRWQGNRNVFVDYPQLVSKFFGEPQTPLEGGGYKCIDETNNNATSKACPVPGDIMAVAVHSDDPDMVAFVALADVSPGIQLFLTDNAWTGSSFRTNEGTRLLMVPDEGIPRGSVFGYGLGLLYGDQWQSAAGSFSLAAGGDALLLYCQLEDDDTIEHITAFSYNGDWMEPGLVDSDYGTGFSALPAPLSSVGATSLPHFDNYVYQGRTRGTMSSLQSELMKSANWEGSNSEQIQPPASFTVTSETVKAGLSSVVLVPLLFFCWLSA